MKAKEWVKRIEPLKACATQEQTDAFLAAVNELELECRQLIVNYLERLESKKDLTERDFARGYLTAMVEAASKWNAVVHGVTNGGSPIFPLCRGLIAMDLIRFFKETINRENDLMEKFGPKHSRLLIMALYKAIQDLPASVGFHDSPMAPKILQDLDMHYANFLSEQFGDLFKRGATMTQIDYINAAARLQNEVKKLSASHQMMFAANLSRLHMGNAFKTRGVGF